jgi:dTDP-4-dehydrorhamnose reductase
MERLAKNEIEPIIGLVHHGSGPRFTDLLDESFPHLLGEYADRVGARYKHIRYVTPVNEPLTTARFSALYGHWYPHRKSPHDFAHALLNQCIATRSAFMAMKRHNPSIKLVQTEDLGRVSSTPRLSYQADFENERRWLTFDLLCGQIDENHAMWPHLALDDSLISKLASLAEHPCPPSIIGINYYVTSDRFLDERIRLYPDTVIGGNGRDRYADVESVRAAAAGITGHATILVDAWNRYRLPLAITESHMGCTREQQVRWLMEAWNDAHAARNAGCDVRAVTAWALFGSFGWNTLVTRAPFNYESGAFDVRGSFPRETAVAKTIRSLASSGSCSHPIARSPGWWHTNQRFTLPSFTLSCSDSLPGISPRHTASAEKPVLITGAGGTLGSAVLRLCRERGIAAHGVTRSELDITDALQVRRAIERFKPWAIVNAAGYVRVDDAELDRSACYKVNAEGAASLARECSSSGIQLVSFSTDLVFDGTKNKPYIESDQPAPINAYGESKSAAERSVFEAHGDALIIRTSAFFGRWDEANFAHLVLESIGNGIPFQAAYDCNVSPTYVPDLVEATMDLLIDEEKGIWHLANAGNITWYEFAREIASKTLHASDLVRPVSIESMGLAARRPKYSALTSERGSLLPSLEDALKRWADSRFAARAAALQA